MNIKKTDYKAALNLMQHCLRSIKDSTGKNRELIVTPGSIWLIEDGRIVLSGESDITNYLHGYYNES